MKVALVQMDSTEIREKNEEKALRLMEQAMEQNPDIICLSESFVYWGKDETQRHCRLEDIEKYQSFARKNEINLVLGSVSLIQENSDKTTNSCFVINRKGEIVHRYDKKYMYRVNKENLQIDEEERTIPRRNKWYF